MSNRSTGARPFNPLAHRKPALGAGELSRFGEGLRAVFDTESDELPAALVGAVERLGRALEGRAAAQPGGAIREALIAALPALRRFALSLTHDANRSDDLVQDTVVRAWDKADSFQVGTNLNAWLFTILRNLFYTDQRKRQREVEDADGIHAGRLTALPDQEARVEVSELRSALRHLPAAQREALLLVGAQSFTYEEVAEICGVAVGTMKSRVSRARAFLVARLGIEGGNNLGVDAMTRAVMCPT